MALAKDTVIKLVEGLLQTFPVYQSVKIYEGSMVFLTSGYACVTAGGNAFVGHAWAQADNSAGSSGAKDVYVRKGPYAARVTLASIAITDVGKNVYASDDGTYTLTSTSNSLVGKVLRYAAANTCDVLFEPAGATTAVTVAQQAHIVNAKTDYTTGDLDTEAELITAINASNTKINAILTALETAGVLASA